MKKTGFTLVEIMIVVVIIAILAAIVIPQLIASRKMSKQSQCLNNLKVNEFAKDQAALALGTASGGNVTTATKRSFMKDWQEVGCPSDGTYSSMRMVGTPSSCSIHGTVTSPRPLDSLTD